MWSSTSSAFSEEPDPEFLRRMSAPENEIPVAVPLNTLLARTPDVAVAMTDVQVYSTGVQFRLAVRARRPWPDPHGLNELIWEHRAGPERFLVGVEFSDGRRSTSPGRFDGEGDVVFHPGGGSGGETAVDQSWWLSPLPPEGPLRFVVRCSALGIDETSTVVDGTLIRQAAQDVVELWPWTPPDHSPPSPPPPDVPPDSWFSRG